MITVSIPVEIDFDPTREHNYGRFAIGEMTVNDNGIIRGRVTNDMGVGMQIHDHESGFTFHVDARHLWTTFQIPKRAYLFSRGLYPYAQEDGSIKWGPLQDKPQKPLVTDEAAYQAVIEAFPYLEVLVDVLPLEDITAVNATTFTKVWDLADGVFDIKDPMAFGAAYCAYGRLWGMPIDPDFMGIYGETFVARPGDEVIVSLPGTMLVVVSGYVVREVNGKIIVWVDEQEVMVPESRVLAVADEFLVGEDGANVLLGEVVELPVQDGDLLPKPGPYDLD